MTAKEGLLTFKCVDCNKTFEKKLDEDLSNRFENTYRLPVDNFKWKKKKSRSIEKFVQNYDDDRNKRCILEVGFSYPKH